LAASLFLMWDLCLLHLGDVPSASDVRSHMIDICRRMNSFGINQGTSGLGAKQESGTPLSDRSLLCPNNPWASPRVDLGDSGAVVAALINGEDYGPAKDGALGAQWTTPRAFGKSTPAKKIPDLPKLRGKRDLTSNNLPRLLWLSNSKEPRTTSRYIRDKLFPKSN
jgi:hypothetical protein